jgi:hypothetical protein
MESNHYLFVYLSLSPPSVTPLRFSSHAFTVHFYYQRSRRRLFINELLDKLLLVTAFKALRLYPMMTLLRRGLPHPPLVLDQY